MGASVSNRGPIWGIRGIIGLVIGILLVLAVLLPGLIRLIIIGGLIAYLLDPAVLFFERRGLTRTVAAASVFALLSLLIFLMFVSMVPTAISQMNALRALDVASASRYLDRLDQDLDHWFAQFSLGPVNVLTSLKNYLMVRIPDVLVIVPNALSFIGSLVLLPFIVFFLLKDSRSLKKGCISLVPNRYFEFILGLLYKMDRQLGNYLRGQLIEAAVVAFLSVLALWLAGVPYFLPVGLFAGAANIIPYLGPIAGSVTAVSIILITGGSLSTVALVLVLFILIQMVDNSVVQPLVIARNVNLHPLVVVISVVAGGQLFGFLGLLLAVPLVAVVQVLVVETLAYLRRYRVDSPV